MTKPDIFSSLSSDLLAWYHEKARILPWRSDPTPYHVWISEIMLQQTRVDAAFSYYLRFLEEIPDSGALAALPEERLMKLWEGLGYYSRVRNLQKAAKLLTEKYHGELPADPALLRELPGIGEYTAGAIASIAFGIPVPAVDGNVLRVFSRLLADPRDMTEPAARKEITALVTRLLPHECPGDFNQALMDLGATVCLPNGQPLCESCPFVSYCRAHQCHQECSFPFKPPKKPRRIEERTILRFYAEDSYLLRKRPSAGLLRGQWEFPSLTGLMPASSLETALKEEFCVCPERILPLTAAKHIFTHIEWHMTGYEIILPRQIAIDNCRWVTREELTQIYAIPSAFRAYLP